MQPVRLRGGKMRQRIWASGDVNAVWPKLTNAESTGGKRQKDTVSRKLLRQQMKYAFQMKSSDWKQMALEYTQNSSLHGLRYMGSTDLHFTERLFWIVSFLLAVITAAYFITNLVTKWNEMPVIVSLSPTSTPLTSIPFPAVTVCNMNNVRKSVAEEILKG
nr:PREDICTED: pickpocket protein 28-like [Bemisia tabaci]